jgi:hypothetical protein
MAELSHFEGLAWDLAGCGSQGTLPRAPTVPLWEFLGQFHQPSRNSWAMPRAFLRSTFTINAESTAFAWCVSSSTASKPALTRAAESCRSGECRAKLTVEAELCLARRMARLDQITEGQPSRGAARRNGHVDCIPEA